MPIMTDRLQWMKDGNGFIAYPEGPTATGRKAQIHFDITKPKGSQWHWIVNYDGASHNGWVEDKQRASDEANRMWAGTRKQAQELAEQKKATETLKALVDRQALIGDVPLEQFDVAASSSDRLRSIIGAANKHFVAGIRGSIPTNLRPLMEACSAELYERRITGHK